jgi:hypothetical protein
MTPQEQHASTLSVHRAFVVHFGAGGGTRRRFSGRVEHLSSGESTHFRSLKGLLAFISQHVDRTSGQFETEGGNGRSSRP